MILFLNGAFLPEEQAMIAASDRGFLLGDGVFETLRVRNGLPFQWAEHLGRLERGAALLRLALARSLDQLRTDTAELIRRNRFRDGALRITLTRGPGPRGYSITGAGPPTLMMALHPAPAPGSTPPSGERLVTSSFRMAAGDPLAAVKTTSKALWIVARAEAEERGADEALLLNTDGCLAEATAANLFWIERGAVVTPPVSAGLLPGITRDLVLEMARAFGLSAEERNAPPRALLEAEGVFLTLSTRGIVPVSSLDGRSLGVSPLVSTLQGAYEERLRAKTSG